MYYPKLYSIRCFAVFAVIFAHMFQIWTWDSSITSVFPLGNAGVVVFFVLSGFLITKLFLDEPTGQPLGASFKNFYMRRILRIFPIYYLYLVVVFSFNLGGIHSTGILPWIYLTNIHIYNIGDWTVPWFSKLPTVVVCLVLVIGVSELSYRVIERPLLRLKDRFRSPHNPAPTHSPPHNPPLAA